MMQLQLMQELQFLKFQVCMELVEHQHGITEAISGKKSYTKGVKVEIDEKTVKIDTNIIVEYGARIPDVAFEIQTKVKKSVETMTGLKVSEVNVNVQGVHAITEKDEDKAE